MIVENIETSYFCTHCKRTVKMSDLNSVCPIEDVHKHVGTAQCVNCKSVGTVESVHIKCKVSKRVLSQYRYTLRCTLCHTTWTELSNMTGLMQIKKHLDGKSKCMNLNCVSQSFSFVSYQKVDN